MNLIEQNSPAYKKRLVREINSALRSGHSVYAVSHPSNVKVKAITFGRYTSKLIYTDCYNNTGSATRFVDGAGSEIVASREVRR